MTFLQVLIDAFTFFVFITSCKIGERVAENVLFVVRRFVFVALHLCAY